MAPDVLQKYITCLARGSRWKRNLHQSIEGSNGERLSPLYNGSYDDAAKLRHIRRQVNERVPYNL